MQAMHFDYMHIRRGETRAQLEERARALCAKWGYAFIALAVAYGEGVKDDVFGLAVAITYAL